MNRKIIKFLCQLSITTFLILWFLDVEISMAFGIAVTIALCIDVAYDKWLWCLNPFEQMPRISGKYDALFISTYKGQTYHNSVITIKQTLSSISIFEESKDGYSTSITASLQKSENSENPWSLYYMYKTSPHANDHDDVHDGAVHLHLVRKGFMDGGYYTNRLEQTKGRLILQKRKRRNKPCPIDSRQYS